MTTTQNIKTSINLSNKRPSSFSIDSLLNEKKLSKYDLKEVNDENEGSKNSNAVKSSQTFKKTSPKNSLNDQNEKDGTMSCFEHFIKSQESKTKSLKEHSESFHETFKKSEESLNKSYENSAVDFKKDPTEPRSFSCNSDFSKKMFFDSKKLFIEKCQQHASVRSQPMQLMHQQQLKHHLHSLQLHLDYQKHHCNLLKLKKQLHKQQQLLGSNKELDDNQSIKSPSKEANPASVISTENKINKSHNEKSNNNYDYIVNNEVKNDKSMDTTRDCDGKPLIDKTSILVTENLLKINNFAKLIENSKMNSPTKISCSDHEKLLPSHSLSKKLYEDLKNKSYYIKHKNIETGLKEYLNSQKLKLEEEMCGEGEGIKCRGISYKEDNTAFYKTENSFCQNNTINSIITAKDNDDLKSQSSINETEEHKETANIKEVVEAEVNNNENEKMSPPPFFMNPFKSNQPPFPRPLIPQIPPFSFHPGSIYRIPQQASPIRKLQHNQIFTSLSPYSLPSIPHHPPAALPPHYHTHLPFENHSNQRVDSYLTWLINRQNGFLHNRFGVPGEISLKFFK